MNFFSDLKCEYYCKYYSEILLRLKWALNKKLKLMEWGDGGGREGAWNIFWKNYWAMKYLGL